MSISISTTAAGSVTAVFTSTTYTSPNSANVVKQSELPGQELRERPQSVIAARGQAQQQQVVSIDNAMTAKSASHSNLGLGTSSVAGTIEANHRLHMLLPRIQSRLAALAAIQAEAETKSQAAPATLTSQPPAPASDSDTDSASSDTDSETGGVQTPPAMDIPTVLVTDHSDFVFTCVDHPEEEAGGEGGGFAGMTSLSYHGDLSELAKEGGAVKGTEKMVGPFRFPPPRCDVRELLSPQAVPRSQWTKKCRPVAAQIQRQQRPQQRQQQPFQFKPDAPIAAGRVLEIEEMGRLLEALTQQGTGVEFDEQRVRDREAMRVLMERMGREIEEEGCSRQEANMIMFQVLRSVGLGLEKKLKEQTMEAQRTAEV